MGFVPPGFAMAVWPFVAMFAPLFGLVLFRKVFGDWPVYSFSPSCG